jgi:transcriptional pleiotropic regulator of transition state genes
MKKSKRLTGASGVTIPKDMRTEMGFHPGMAVDLETTEDGVLLKPHVPICHFCGSPEDVAHVSEINICRECAVKVREGLAKHGK